MIGEEAAGPRGETSPGVVPGRAPEVDRERAGRPEARRAAVLGLGGLAFVAVLAAGVAVLVAEVAEGAWVAFAALLLLGVLSDKLRERESSGEIEFTFTAVIFLAAIPLCGPVGAALLGPCMFVLSRLRPPGRRRATDGGGEDLPWVVVAVNAAMAAVMALAAAIVYFAVGGEPVSRLVAEPANLLTRLGLPLLVADLALCVFNALIVAAMISSTTGGGRHFLTRTLPRTLPLYLGYGLTAFLFVVLWGPVGVGPLSVVLILGPLLVARWVYVQYADERRVHERLLDTLARAGSCREGDIDRSARIAGLCVALHAQLGMTGEDLEILRRASALHDIGIVAVSWELLDRDAELLTEADLVRIAAHVYTTKQVIGDIDFLEAVTVTVLHHHERVDGHGYPHGLVGTDIPLTSRVLAVADVAEHLAAGGPGRSTDLPRLLGALWERAGSHLDPAVVTAFAGLARTPRGAEALCAALEVGDTPRRAASVSRHAAPAVSDRFAEFVREGRIVLPLNDPRAAGTRHRPAGTSR